MEDLDLTHRDESKGFMIMFKNRVYACLPTWIILLHFSSLALVEYNSEVSEVVQQLTKLN
jgi:hypothetical protein